MEVILYANLLHLPVEERIHTYKVLQHLKYHVEDTEHDTPPSRITFTPERQSLNAGQQCVCQ